MNFSRVGAFAIICAVAAPACIRRDPSAADTGDRRAAESAPVGSSTAPAPTGVRDAQERTSTADNAMQGEADVRAFVISATADGTAEIELGRMAVQRAGDPQVKRFGQDMATDHVRVGDELQQIVEQLRISLPVSPSTDDHALVRRLSKLKGRAFDRAYIDAMVIAHRRMVDLLQQQGQARLRKSGGGGTGTGSHPPMATDGTAAAGQVVLFEWAAKTLPIVLAHLDRARQLQSRLAPGRVSAK
jgi:predicted outer membrane protein